MRRRRKLVCRPCNFKFHFISNSATLGDKTLSFPPVVVLRSRKQRAIVNTWQSIRDQFAVKFQRTDKSIHDRIFHCHFLFTEVWKAFVATSFSTIFCQSKRSCSIDIAMVFFSRLTSLLPPRHSHPTMSIATSRDPWHSIKRSATEQEGRATICSPFTCNILFPFPVLVCCQILPLKASWKSFFLLKALLTFVLRCASEKWKLLC